MSERYLKTGSFAAGARLYGLLALLALAPAIAVALAAPHARPLALGGALLGYLLACAALVALRLRRRCYARWREVMPCYLSVQDADLRIVDVNELFKRDFGDRIGERCHVAYKGSETPCPDCPVLRTFADGRDHTSEETVVTKDGDVAEVVVTSTPLLDEHGRVSAVVEMSTNVTEVKGLRRELERTRRDYKRLFDHVPCYVAVVDRALEIVEANLLYRRDFGDPAGRRCYEACKGRGSPCPRCKVKQTFADGRVHSGEEVLTTRDGRRVDVIVYSMPVRDERGEITSVVEMYTDITEVKRLQSELTLMGRAVAGMAHRTKNVLMGLEGGIFIVNEGMAEGDDAQIEQGWSMVQRNVGRVSTIVKDLLFCSKARAPRFEDAVQPAAVLRDVRELYAQRVAKDGIRLSEDVAEVPPGRFDPEGLHNLLSNLVANAIDACRFDTDPAKEQHTITLRLRPEPKGAITMEVEDDGPGIPEEHSDKVFEDFFSTKGTEGTGVGLLVVQKVAREHGGSVTFTSRPGRGTCFQVVIPEGGAAG